ncbi:MAG: thioredoxin family protein [Chloroflexota bacterium]
MALAIGDNAIPFDLPGVDGKNHTFVDYSDKEAVAVVFTCNHCPYVLAWEDRLIAVQNDYADKGVQLIGIGANDAVKYPADDMDSSKKHAAEKGINFPYLRDETQEIATSYGAERTPEIFLFDKTGKLRYHGAVDDNYENPDAVSVTYFRDALDALLANSDISTTQTAPVGCTIKWK